MNVFLFNVKGEKEWNVKIGQKKYMQNLLVTYIKGTFQESFLSRIQHVKYKKFVDDTRNDY